MDTIFLLIAALITLVALDLGGWSSRIALDTWSSISGVTILDRVRGFALSYR